MKINLVVLGFSLSGNQQMLLLKMKGRSTKGQTKTDRNMGSVVYSDNCSTEVIEGINYVCQTKGTSGSILFKQQLLELKFRAT